MLHGWEAGRPRGSEARKIMDESKMIEAGAETRYHWLYSISHPMEIFSFFSSFLNSGSPVRRVALCMPAKAAANESA